MASHLLKDEIPLGDLFTSVQIERGSTFTPLRLDNGDTYLWDRSDGFGMPPIEIIHEETPERHGSIYLGFRWKPRRLSFRIRSRSKTPASFYAQLAALYSLFSPFFDKQYTGDVLKESPLTMRLTRKDGEVRLLDVYFAGGLDPASIARQGLVQTLDIHLLALNPFWHDGGRSLPGWPGNLVRWQGEQYIDVPLECVGSWWSWPVLEISAPNIVGGGSSYDIINPALYLSQEFPWGGDDLCRMEFEGLTLANESHSVLRLVPEFGLAEIDGVDVSGKMTPESDMARFQIGPTGYPTKIRIVLDTATSEGAISVMYPGVYLGI